MSYTPTPIQKTIQITLITNQDVPPDSDEVDKYNCNRHAKNQLSDIIYISHFEHVGVHSFLCTSAQFSVHKVGMVPVKAGEKIYILDHLQ